MSRNVNEPTFRVDGLGRTRASKSLAERTWRRVDKSGGPEACWPFAERGRNRKGYGVLGGRPKNLAHRVAWESVNGPIPDGLYVLHHCDNPPCCNPGHLFLGTIKDNSDDMVAKGRASDMRNERCGKTRLSNAQVADIRTRWVQGETISSLAAEYEVNSGHLSRVIHGKRRPPEDSGTLPARSPEALAAVRATAAARKRAALPEHRRLQIEAAEQERTRSTAEREARERQYDEAQRLYESGLSTVAVGEQLGLHHAVVWAALHRRGVAIRTGADYLPSIDREAVRELHAQGVRAGAMCARLGVGRRRLYQVFDELGLPRFGSGAPPKSESPEGSVAA